MPNYGFTTTDLENLAELRDTLSSELDNINDAITEINDERLPQLNIVEGLFKKFYDVYENVIEPIDDLVELCRGWLIYRVTDYPTNPYPNQGYEIQNACDYTYTGDVKVFPTGWYYIYPYYAADYGFTGYGVTSSSGSEWDLLTAEETDLNRYSTMTPRALGDPIVLPSPTTITVGKLNLDAQYAKMNSEITAINNAIAAINASGLSLATFLSAFNAFKTSTQADMVIVQGIISDPYSKTIASRKTRINDRRTHINTFLAAITNTSASTIFDPRKHWMDCRINRSYGSLRQIYSAYNSLQMFNYRKTMIETTIAAIDTVI